LLPGFVVALACGGIGGLFARLLTASLTYSPDGVSKWRSKHPLRFVALGAFAVAVIGIVTGGATFGAGSEAVKHMLAGHADVPKLYVTLKLVATWLTAWCGVPGGIFAPSLSIGAGIGHNVSDLAALIGVTDTDISAALIAMGMAGFLAAVTQAPLTSFIIVMEMIDGHSMVLSLMTTALIASLISRLICRPLYLTLAEHMVRGIVPLQDNEAATIERK
jgi:H+/Cl- antiporter ClcA